MSIVISSRMIALWCLFLMLISMPPSNAASPGRGDNGANNFNVTRWCVADEQMPDDVLQQALDWACGPGGADCKDIQIGGPCYVPNTKKDHASFAFNSYWQKYKTHGASCNFNNAAIITEANPSHDGCHFQSVH